MSEGKVNWNYTCLICKGFFPYGAIAGSAINVCPKCKEVTKVRFVDLNKKPVMKPIWRAGL